MATQDESAYNDIPNTSNSWIESEMSAEEGKCAQSTSVQEKRRSHVHFEEEGDGEFGIELQKGVSCCKTISRHFGKNINGHLEVDWCPDKKGKGRQNTNGYLQRKGTTELKFGTSLQTESIGEYKNFTFSHDNIEPNFKHLLGRESMGKKKVSDNKKNQSDANRYEQIFPITSSRSLLNKNIDNHIEFFDDVKNIYRSCAENVSGTISECVGISRKNNQDHWIVAICTVNGQQHCYGSERVSFSLQEIADPINYCLATEQYGTTAVHEHIGFTPSCSCNSVEKLSIPLNPFTESGSLLVNAMLSKDIPTADRFDDLMNLWEHLVGGKSLGYSNSIYLSNKHLAHSMHATGYLMKKADIFPDNVDVSDAVDSLIQNRSIMVTSEQLAVAAATLANRGKCPLTGKTIFSVSTVQNCLSLMVNCGLGNFSGEFAFRFGLPAKSSCSGSIMITIPNVMGICLYSPRLNDKGHSARGIEFIEKFSYLFHTFDSLNEEKKKSRRHSIV